MTTTSLAERLTDDQIISKLVSSHGSIALAAERLNCDINTIIERLPDLPYDRLVQGIKAARVLQAFDAFITMKDVLFNTLPDLNPSERARFMIQFMDRFEVMLNPPVHGGSGQPNSNATNVQINLGSPEAQEDARVELANRLRRATVESELVEGVQVPEYESTDSTADGLDTGTGLHSTVRLGVDGEAEAIRAIRALDDMAPVDRTGIREDADWRPDNEKES